MSHTAFDAGQYQWIGATLGEQFATRLVAQLPHAAERLGRQAEQAHHRISGETLRKALMLLRNPPMSLAMDVQNAVAAAFSAKLARLTRARKAGALSFSLDALSLVDDAQMREEIQVGKAVQKMREEIGSEFYALTLRLCHLTGREDIPDGENPGFPATLMQALIDALRPACPAQDLLLACFDGAALAAEACIVAAYAAVNAEMVKRGVLIEIRENTIRHLSSGPARKKTGQAAEATPATAAPAAQTATDTKTAETPLPPASPPPAAPRPATRGPSTRAEAIAATFEQLKRDPRLRPAGDALWNTLLPGVLRAAARDETLLADDARCIRACLDRFADFTVSLQPEEHALDGTHDAMMRIAAWLAEFHDRSDRAFEMAAEKLDALIDQFESNAAASRLETQVIAEYEVLEEARSAARGAITAAFAGGNVPTRLMRFAEGFGFEVLINDYLNGGREGELWRRDIETLHMLIESLRPISTNEERMALAQQLPIIVSRLSVGLARAHRSPEDLRQFLAELRPYYEAAASGQTSAALVLPPAPVSAPEVERTNALAPVPNLGAVRWVAFNDAGGANEQRCRMNWMSPSRTTYLFRNYDDREYRAMNVNDLVQRFRGGLARHVSGLEIATYYLQNR